MVQAMQMVRASRIATVHRWCCGRTRKWRTCIACGFESTRRLGGSHQATQRRPSGCRATEGVACGCHTARELTSWLATERKTRRCPIFRFLRHVTCLWSLRSKGPSPCLSFTRKGRESETSWLALLEQIRTLASAQDASVALKADVELVGKSWAAIRRCLRVRGPGYAPA